MNPPADVPPYLDLIHQGFAHHQAGRLAEAAPLYRRALALEPAQSDTLHMLGLVERHIGDPGHGLTLIRRALAAQPDLALACYNLGNSLFGLGRLEESAAALRRLLVLEPAHAGALFLCGRLLLHTSQPAEAERQLVRAAALETPAPAVPEERLRLAMTRCRRYRELAATAADSRLSAGLIIRGVFRDGSGYAYTVRRFARHLVEAGVPVQLIDLLYLDEHNLPSNQLDPLLADLERPVRARAVLHFTTPPMVEAVPGLKTVNYTLAETRTVPDQWVRHSQRHDGTIVATASSRAAWLDGGYTAGHLHVCPAGVDPVAAGSLVPACVTNPTGPPLSHYRTRILNISDFNLRKNLEGLLRVWLKTTRAGDDAALVLKIGKTAGIVDGARRLLARAVLETGIQAEAAAPVFIIVASVSDQDILSLFAACTHYMSLSHGEGWDLPMTQAGAMGLTLIAPRHSAYTAYLDDGTAHLLPCTLSAADPVYPGLDWWQPDEDAAARLLARLIRKPDGDRRSARERLLGGFTWKQAARTLITTLEALEAL